MSSKTRSLQRTSQNLLLSVDNVNESRLQAGAANKETVNVGLLGEVLAVLLADGAAVDDTGGLGDLLAELLVEPLADALVNLLRLLGGGDLAGADGPDGLVGDDDLAPVLDLLADGGELVDDDLHGLVGLALLEGLADAEDDVDAAVESGLGLVGDESVALLQDDAALAVADQSPGNVGVLELRGGDLAGESAVGLVEDVLGGDLDALAGVLAGEEEVEGGRGDDDLGVGIDLGVVELVDDVGDRLNGAVPVGGRKSVSWAVCLVSLWLLRGIGSVHLEVTADEELTRHDCGIVWGVVGRRCLV
jgi:hypothetical protein